MRGLTSHLQTLIGVAQRHPGMLALFGFVSGLASFLLIERNETLAQLIALMMLVSWVWLVLEQTLRDGVLARFGLDMPPALLRFATQMVHQESFFFVLPFFFAATHWGTGQVWATALLAACALVSLIDPLYYGQLATRRALFVAFHALALFATLLVALPIILHLTTGQSYLLSLLIALLFSLPGIAALLPPGHPWRALALGGLLAMLAVAAWQVRHQVAPVPMRLAEVAVTHQVDRQARRVGAPVTHLDAGILHQQGLYAWSAIRVPRGLRETVYHVWIHEGRVVDRIALDVRGGRDEGYRAWSFKRHFPRHAEGEWQVRITTGAGRVIGMTRFSVHAGDREPESVIAVSPPPEASAPTADDDTHSDSNADSTEPLASEIEEAIDPDETIL
jgi:hypothetical protein